MSPPASTPLPEFLTTREVAALLRVKERKVYDLAASSEIPCRRLTGKLLFPRAEIEAWLAHHQGTVRLSVEVPQPNILVGSHDPLLDWALRESRSGIATFLDGSLDGLARMRRHEAGAAGIHVYEPEREVWNRGHVEEALGQEAVVLLEWAWRERGLILAPGNPHGVADLAGIRGLRVVPRQPEAGSQVLFTLLLERTGLHFNNLQLIHPPARSEVDLGLAVADGKADAGFGLAAVARQLRLAFVPVIRERYDLLVWRRAYFEPPMQRLFEFCRTEAFHARADELGGYDVGGLGTVHYNGP
jgi:excisionase family DNA binding protein